jgi:hypothetical protein
MKHKLMHFLSAALGILLIGGCQKLDKPEVGDYPPDSNPPGGPLAFYAAFDGTTANPLMNAVDSIRANFPSENPLQTVDGVKGKGVQGSAKKFIKYPSFNDWTGSSSFSVSVWFKKNGQTLNNVGGNGTEYIFSMRSSENSYHWSNGIMFLFLEGNNTACAVKVMCVSPSNPNNPNSSATDAWFTWEGGQSIPGILNDAWHHMVITYDATTSAMRLYIDGVVNPNVKSWANHGAIRLASAKIGEFRIGRGPRNDGDGDGESGWLQSSFKGVLDQFRLYSKALTAEEIQYLFATKR